LLAYVEQEIERQGGCAKIYDDMFVVVGSRKVVTPGLAKLHAIGFIEGHPKYSICHSSQRWRSVASKRDATMISATARYPRKPLLPTPVTAASVYRAKHGAAASGVGHGTAGWAKAWRGKAAKVWQGRACMACRGRGNRMRHPTDDEIMRALCCGGECAVGPKNTGHCHRWDFTSEAARIRALLDQHGEKPTCMDRSSEPEEA
jgi:hypothetical protein